MAKETITEVLAIPEGIQVSVEDQVVTVTGEKGSINKKVFNPAIGISVNGNNVEFEVKVFNKRIKKLVNTFRAHISNMYKGVTQGHVYKLKICSGHFPMTVGVKDNVFEIKNFIGEKVPRTLNIREDTKVTVDGTDITVESLYKEKAGQMAASIEQLTRRPGFDTRIFQDGIYITEKDGKAIK